MSPEATYVVESMATLAAFGVAVAASLWGYRKVQGALPRGPMEVIARQPLDGRRAIYLVRVGKRVLVVGATDASLTRLGSTSVEAIEEERRTAEKEADARAPESSGGFRDALARALGRKRDPS